MIVMQKKFSLIISLLILFIIIFIIYNIYDLGNKSSENQYNRLVNDLNKDTTDFTSWISDKKEILNTAKDIVDNFSYDEIVSRNTLNPYLNINNDDPDISQIYIGLATGKFITGGKWIPPDGYDPRTRIWYREAVEADKTIISDVYIDLETGDRTVTISSPLYLEEEFAGVISADIFMNDINDWLSNQLTSRNVYTYILDSKGTVIVHTVRPELVGTNIYKDKQIYNSFFKELDLFIKYFEEVKRGQNIVRMEYVVNGKKTRGIIRKIEGGEWYLSAATIEDHDLSNFIKMNRDNILFNFLILGIIILLLLLVIRIKHELEKQNRLLLVDNERDFLTGIFNRRYFNLFMENLWESADENSEVSLLMMDIDYFKRYNDTYGHIMGDKILKNVTSVINHTIRKQDVFARYGGEEFVLVLEKVPIKDAEKIAGKILEAVYDLNIENTPSPHGRITISIGVASLKNCNKVDIAHFIETADQALYEAKASGRNRAIVFK